MTLGALCVLISGSFLSLIICSAFLESPLSENTMAAVPGASTNSEMSCLRDSPCYACQLIMASVCMVPCFRGDSVGEALSST